MTNEIFNINFDKIYSMRNALYLIGILFIVTILTEILVAKTLNIKWKCWEQRYVNKLHVWLSILLVAFTITLMGRGIILLNHPPGIYLLGLTSVLCFLDLFMQWKFNKKSRRYILRIFDAVFAVSVFIIIVISYF